MEKERFEEMKQLIKQLGNMPLKCISLMDISFFLDKVHVRLSVDDFMEQFDNYQIEIKNDVATFKYEEKDIVWKAATMSQELFKERETR